jgi:NAD(P)H-dependent FMN reductase
MQKLNIPILIGTTRVQRKSIHAARLVEEVGKTIDRIKVFLVDPNDFNFPGDGNDPEGKDPKYTKITADADGFVIVSPEYNHSFPGSLKRMLDSELKNYIHKPVAFAGVSSNPWGGVRAIEALVGTVREMGMVATFTDVQFPRINQLFDENGHLMDENYRGYIETMFTELVWMADVLKWGRQNVSSKYHN